MKVARNQSHNLRHDWLKLEDEKGRVKLSLLAHRSEICVEVEIDGRVAYDWLAPRQVAEAIISKMTESHEKP